MTGPEHYREAERLQRAAAALADAQVHATLAVASALGLSADLGAGVVPL